MSDEKQPITPVAEAKRFMVDCFIAAGSNLTNAEIIADNLIEADIRGHYSHGMNRLQMYIKDIQEKRCDPNATCKIEKETIATALVNGNNGFGALVGKYSMDLAIKKAKEVGIGMVSAHVSNHYGIAGIYSLQAVKQGMIGMTFTNTSPFMVPTRAKEPALGTNPLSMGAPGLDGDSFLLDMATTAVAAGKVEMARRKDEPIPEGWVVTSKSQTVTDPRKSKKSFLMPTGGSEDTGGHKGYGMGMFVEILCGILSGSNYGPNIRSWEEDVDKHADLGQCFIAINPDLFAEGFQRRLSDLMNFIRNMTPLNPDRPISIHGDMERSHAEKVNEQGGLTYVPNQHETNANLAEQLNVKPMISV